MSRMTKHGVAGYRIHQCRCETCVKAYQKHLKNKRKSNSERGKVRKLPSVTNTLEHDTMTREEFMRLRYDEDAV